MSIVINPAASVAATQAVAAQGVTAGIILQPGTVINAQVLQILGNDQVQIAISGQPLDVTSQVPLQAGQTLQLSVSQADNGNINLAVVNQPATATTASTVNPATINATSDALALAASGNVTAPATAAAPQNQLTTLQALAVSGAAESAAAQVLAQRTSLAPSLTGGDIKYAFQNSGLFLESSLALGSVTSGTPDLKGALIVLRQVLTTAIDAAPATTAAVTTTA